MRGENISGDFVVSEDAHDSCASTFGGTASDAVSTVASTATSTDYMLQLSECDESINSEFNSNDTNMQSDSETSTTECIICRDAPINIVLAPCAHSITCTQCADRIETCPICRCILVKPEAPESNIKAITQDVAVIGSLFMVINIIVGAINIQFFDISLHDTLIISGMFSFLICVLTITAWFKQLKNNQAQRAVDNYTVV